MSERYIDRTNTFAHSRLDRSAHLREDEDWLRHSRASARISIVWRSRSLISVGEVPTIALFSFDELAELLQDHRTRETLVLLGIDNDIPYFAIDLSHHDEPMTLQELQGACELQDLRQLASMVEPHEGALLAHARAITTWHQNHRHCGACGAQTTPGQSGYVRVCTSCDRQHFPRTDPAVIMLIHDGGDRCLLGRQARWPSRTFSTLAGFVEPGESLEMAVAREVMEETGVRVVDSKYHSSQPWPFPSSIMLGFHGEARYSEPLVSGELEAAVWLTRDELRERKMMRELRLPPRLSIARRLIDEWLERGPL